MPRTGSEWGIPEERQIFGNRQAAQTLKRYFIQYNKNMFILIKFLLSLHLIEVFNYFEARFEADVMSKTIFVDQRLGRINICIINIYIICLQSNRTNMKCKPFIVEDEILRPLVIY